MNPLTSLFKNLFKNNSKRDPRMYLILREDLSFKYIQGAHALTKFAIEYPMDFKEWNNSYLICLSVFNGIKLREFVRGIEDKLSKLNMSEFYEPDLKSFLPTAVCFFDDGNDEKLRKYLKRLPLATK